MKLDKSKQNALKDALGKKAASLIKNGMLVGLGTGTTTHYFIEHLLERTKQGLNIKAVSSSIKSAEQAAKGGINVLNMDEITSIDITVDGADEIDPHNQMIKGGGGALLREKILATNSKEMLVIVDESKLVSELGAFGLPIEIIPFGYKATMNKLEALGYSGKLRLSPQNEIYITDNGNYILDIKVPNQFSEPKNDHEKIKSIPGVIETGFFFNLPTKVLVGYSNGEIIFRE